MFIFNNVMLLCQILYCLLHLLPSRSTVVIKLTASVYQTFPKQITNKILRVRCYKKSYDSFDLQLCACLWDLRFVSIQDMTSQVFQINFSIRLGTCRNYSCSSVYYFNQNLLYNNTNFSPSVASSWIRIPNDQTSDLWEWSSMLRKHSGASHRTNDRCWKICFNFS